eukprot:CAMPEP_0117463946 /NCGR_PEP_ID=MMETSP0784-20121206/3846_1 /TAXON_ID=39447 /ORGANISM="" /LENGTH=127 /DNA_ID=CAMNT_0005257787 /DNA_START=83 /DNA_END=466 /DNA_ORIENTATION=+
MKKSFFDGDVLRAARVQTAMETCSSTAVRRKFSGASCQHPEISTRWWQLGGDSWSQSSARRKLRCCDELRICYRADGWSQFGDSHRSADRLPRRRIRRDARLRLGDEGRKNDRSTMYQCAFSCSDMP